MRFQQLLESSDKGTFVGVRLTSDSAKKVLHWLAENKIKDPVTKEELHVTLLLDKHSPIDHKPVRYDPPLVTDLESYKIELFGQDKDILVLTFECPQLESRHMSLRKKYGVSWDWPTYSPHMTLTYKVQEVTEPLEPPTFVIELDQEYVSEFDPSW
jgi:2'-5' RNA ligase